MTTRPTALLCFALIAFLCPVQMNSYAAIPYEASPFAAVVKSSRSPNNWARDRKQNNSVLLLENGYDALLLRVHLIRNATRSIDVQTFIWTNDECGRLLMYELIQAARRGVKVRIIADHFVSDKDPAIVAFLATVHPNIQIKHYRPVADRIKPGKLHVITKAIFRFRNLNQRMHNKVMVFDDVMALTGGRNIENTYYNYSTSMNFRDRDVLVIGPVVREVSSSFQSFWRYRHSVASGELIDVRTIIEKSKVPHFREKKDFQFGNSFSRIERDADDAKCINSLFVDRVLPARRVTFLADKPGKNRSLWLRGRGKITDQIASIVDETRNDLVIQSPYFVLSKPAIGLFRSLRSRDNPVRVVVSSNSFGSTDNTVAYSANYRQRSTTIEKLGLQVHEFKPHPAHLNRIFPQHPEMLDMAKNERKLGSKARLPFLCIHAKTFVSDNRLAYIGTYNLDPRSENLNTEVGILIEDERIASMLKRTIMLDCRQDNSWVIAKRPMPLGMSTANSILQGISGISPIDMWPVRNTSSFELLPDKQAVLPEHPDFYDNYKDVGSFPGAPPGLSLKEIHTRIYKAVGGLATPLL